MLANRNRRSRRRIRNLGGLMFFSVLLASGCGDLLTQPYVVEIDNDGRKAEGAKYDPSGKVDKKSFGAAYFAFLPKTLPMHPGDEAFFHTQSRGEPYVLAMGTMIDKAVKAIEALGEDPTPSQIEALPEMQALPTLLPTEVDPGKVPALNQSVAEPCYLDSGTPPTSATGGADACPDESKPSFNGRQSFFSSGVLEEDNIFRFKLSGDIKPGTYHVMDLIHRSAMIGTIQVFKKSVNLPRPGDIARDAREEAAGLASRLVDAATKAWVATSKTAVAGSAEVGVPAVVLSFGHRYRIDAGTSMNWSVSGMHTITFKPTGDAKDGLFVTRDGLYQVNEAAWLATGNPVVENVDVPEEEQVPSFGSTAPPPPSTIIDGGEWDGSGFHNSGLLRSNRPGEISYKLTFTEPGTYKYYCMLHPVMTGKVTVQ